VDTVLKPQFNTYDPARIQSHPGISTELSHTPPEEILVTDFFGGVASVEITPKDAELDMLRADVPRWEASPRRKTIGRGMEVAWARDSMGVQGDAPVRETVGGAWKRPLERTREGVLGMGMGLKEMGVVVGLAGVIYLLLRPQTGKET
jgi:phosphatidylinositol glycan class K